MFKIWCRFQKWNKIWENVFVFQIIALKFSVANSHNPEHDTCHRMSMYSKTPLRFHLTLGETFSKSTSLTMMENMIKRSHGDFASIWDTFTCWLPKPVLKRCSLESFLTNIFTFCSFGITFAITIIFSFRIFKIWWRFHKCNKKLKKKFFVLKDQGTLTEISQVFWTLSHVECESVFWNGVF